jgi:peptide methionine sulfoxide reductase MsrB
MADSTESNGRTRTEPGTWACTACHGALFSSHTRFTAENGSTGFWEASTPEAVRIVEDMGVFMVTQRVHCAGCDAVVGELASDGPWPTHKRYAVDESKLEFVPKPFDNDEAKLGYLRAYALEAQKQLESMIDQNASTLELTFEEKWLKLDLHDDVEMLKLLERIREAARQSYNADLIHCMEHYLDARQDYLDLYLQMHPQGVVPPPQFGSDEERIKYYESIGDYESASLIRERSNRMDLL